MGYVGNQQAEGFVQRPTKQDLTGATGTSLTLTHAVSKEEDIDLYINNVKQEPTTAYTVADTAVTLTGSVVASDDIYVVYNSLALQTVVPPDGSVTNAKLASGAAASNLGTSVNLATIKDSTGTNTAMTIDSSGNLTASQKLLYGTNQPMFSVRGQNGNAAISGLSLSNISDEGNTTYINSFSQIDVNRGSLYSNGRLVAPVDGVYEINARSGQGSGSTNYRALIVIKLTSGGTTGEEIYRAWTNNDYQYYTLAYSGFLELTAGEQVAVGWNTVYMPHTTSEHEGATVFSAKLIG